MDTNNGVYDSSQNQPNFPGTSFDQAINQLNLQDIPTQTSYPPLVPAASGRHAATFAAHGISYPIAGYMVHLPGGIPPSLVTVAPMSASPDSPPASAPQKQTLPRVPAVQYFTKIANVMTTSALAECQSPRYLTPEEVQEHRLNTLENIAKIRALERDQARILPKADPSIEKALFIARVQYRLRFPRIFRINDLPIEILSNILRFICWSARDAAETTRSRLVITWVCRHWRTIAIADHTIWNAISFTDFPTYDLSFEWFERSGNAAIDIRITDTADHSWTLDHAKKVVSRLFTKLSKIRVLVIILQNWDPIFYILDALAVVNERKLPIIMERLEVHRTGTTYNQIGTNFDDTYYARFVPLFGGADVPTLSHVTMNAFHIDWSSPCLKNLETLDIRRVPLERVPTAQQFRTLLLKSLDMRKLVLDGAGPNWPTTLDVVQAIELPALRSLALGDFSSAYGTYAAAHFTCPNVVDLTLMNVIRQDFTPLWDLMTGRVTSLRALTLYGADLYQDSSLARLTFLNWLKAIPNLKFLRVNSVTPALMNLFKYDANLMTEATGPTSNPVCPELTVLEYHTMSGNYMLEWIAARRHMGVPVQKIYIGESHFKTMKMTDHHKLWMAMGRIGTVHALQGASRPVEELEMLPL